DESAWTVYDILELHELRAAECFSCYVTKPGGLYRARQQAELAAALGIYCDIGGSIELGIGNAANLHLGAALPNAVLPSVCPVTKPAEAAGPAIAGIYYVDDIVTAPFRFEDGKVMTPDGPGLGVEVDAEKLSRYAVCPPSLAHELVAEALVAAQVSCPVLLNPGHTCGALHVANVFRERGVEPPPLVELSTLTYVARKPDASTVRITGAAGRVWAGCLPGSEEALRLAQEIYPA